MEDNNRPIKQEIYPDSEKNIAPPPAEAFRSLPLPRSALTFPQAPKPITIKPDNENITMLDQSRITSSLDIHQNPTGTVIVTSDKIVNVSQSQVEDKNHEEGNFNKYSLPKSSINENNNEITAVITNSKNEPKKVDHSEIISSDGRASDDDEKSNQEDIICSKQTITNPNTLVEEGGIETPSANNVMDCNLKNQLSFENQDTIDAPVSGSLLSSMTSLLPSPMPLSSTNNDSNSTVTRSDDEGDQYRTCCNGSSVASSISLPQSLQLQNLVGSEDVLKQKQKEMMEFHFSPEHLEQGSRSPSILSSRDSIQSRDDLENGKNLEKVRMIDLGSLLQCNQANDKDPRKVVPNINKDGSENNEQLKKTKGKEAYSHLLDSQQMKNSIVTERSNKDKDALHNFVQSSIEEKIEATNENFVHEITISSREYRTNKIPKGAKSLFENLDQTWHLLHNDTSTKTKTEAKVVNIDTEKLCFASLVAVLMESKKDNKDVITRSGKKVSSLENTKNAHMHKIPLQVVKLFWRNVIFPSIDLTIKGEVMETEKVIDQTLSTLLEKLSCLVTMIIPVSSTTQQKQVEETFMVVQLSHQVYSDYGKYILNSLGVTVKKVSEWHARFSEVLQDLLLSEKKKSISSEVQRYAALFVLHHNFSSFRPSKMSSTSSSGLTKTQLQSQQGYYANLLALLSNPRFIKCRMEVLAFDTMNTVESNKNIARKKKKKKSILMPSKSDGQSHVCWDVLKATKIHITDLERCVSSLLSLSPAFLRYSDLQKDTVEKRKEQQTEIVQVIQSILAMYDVWKSECQMVMERERKKLVLREDQIYGIAGEKVSKKSKRIISSQNISNPVKKDAINSVSNIISGVNSNLCSTAKPSTETSLSATASTKASSSSQLTDIPDQPLTRVYDIDSHSITSTLSDATEGSNHIDSSLGVSHKQDGHNKNRYSRGLHGSNLTSQVLGKSSQRNDISTNVTATGMTLSNVLDVDILLLDFEIAVGKAIYVLTESLSKNLLLSSHLNGVLLNSKIINYLFATIEIYTNVSIVLCYLLSEDLADVDEDDIADLGYAYDHGNMNPMSRFKKLKNDRLVARVLMFKTQALCSESWYKVGNCITNAATEKHVLALEVTKISQRMNFGKIFCTELSSVVDETSKKGNEKSSHCKSIEISHSNTWQEQILQSYHVSLSFLNSKIENGVHDSTIKDKGVSNFPSSSESFSANLQDIDFFKGVLKASIRHSLGLHHYELKGNNEMALPHFYASLKLRRQLIRNLQNRNDDGLNRNSINKRRTSVDMIQVPSRNHRSAYTSTSSLSDSEFSKSHDGKVNCAVDPLFDKELSCKEQIHSLEMSLSSTLEYAALVTHSQLAYQESLTMFQEALILRALHAGKMSLDVASLQYNMGVVHDDLGQNEASLGRYSESLRIRLSKLKEMHDHSKDSSKSYQSPNYDKRQENVEELETSVILTLRCMGNVHRALKEPTGAIGCYMAIIKLVKNSLINSSKEENNGGHQLVHGALGFGMRAGGKLLDIAMPLMVLDEMRDVDNSKSSNISPILDAQSLSLKKITKKSNILNQQDKLRKELESMYKTVINLLDLRKQQGSGYQYAPSKSGYTSSGHTEYSSASTSVRSRRSTSQLNYGSIKKGDEIDETDSNEVIMLDSVYNLGIIATYFGEFRNAIYYFEEALRTLWTLFPTGSSGESSDSDSSSARKNCSSKGKVKVASSKAESQDKVEEGVLYHSLAVAYASLSDHERAIRCYVTALRYYRRHLGMDDLKVAGALYDCGLSYWQLGEHNRAGEFWVDCLRILLFNTNDSITIPIKNLYVANTLYNIASSKCADNKPVDSYTVTCVKDALDIFLHKQDAHCSKSKDVAHCYFYLGLINYKIAQQERKYESGGSNKGTHITLIKSQLPSESGESGGVKNTDDCTINSSEEIMNNALSCLDEALNIYLIGPNIFQEYTSKGQNLPKIQNLHHPMQAHVAHLSGLIHDISGNVAKSLWNYTTAIRLYNHVYSTKNLYSASVMHSMGNLFYRNGSTSAAMKCYNDCLDSRSALLGSRHSAIADTLYNLAGIYSTLFEYNNCISIYAQCLKIRIFTEGNGGAGVAQTLLNMGIIHARFGAFKKAMQCLEGALNVRNNRVKDLDKTKTNLTREYLGDCDETHNESLSILQKQYKVEISELGVALHNLGNIHLKIGQVDVAIQRYKEALDLRRKQCGFGDGGFAEISQLAEYEDIVEMNYEELQSMADTLHNLGWSYELKNMFEQALSCFNEALVIKRGISSDSVTHKMARRASNETIFVPRNEHVISSNTISSAITLLRIGSIHVKLSNYDISLSYYESALRIQRLQLGRDHIAVARTLSDMGHVLKRKMKPFQEITSGGSRTDTLNCNAIAMKCFNEALRISRRRFGPYHLTVAGVMYDLGTIYDIQGDHINALNYFKDSLSIYGQRYTNILCKRITHSAVDSHVSYKNSEMDDNDHELFNPTCLDNILTSCAGAGSGFPSPFHASATDKEKQQFYMAATALDNAAQRVGLNNLTILFGLSGNTNISGKELWKFKLQFYLVKLIEHISTAAVDPVREIIQKNIQRTIKQLEKLQLHATINSYDSTSNQFLYLIPE